MMLEARAVSQAYRARTVVSEVSFRVAEGTVGLLGPNGAGKTTLLRTLATIVPPRSGQVLYEGSTPLTPASLRQIRRNIGWLPQQFGFYPGFTVFEFVRYCAWLRGVPDATADHDTREAITSVGLADWAGVKLRKLSGGMQRRVGIAQATVGAPRLVLLDEPTVGLDPEQRLEFRELIRSWEDRAVILSTHLVEDVAAVCDRVLVLHGGRIAFDGSVADLAALAGPEGRGDTPLESGYLAALSGRVAAA